MSFDGIKLNPYIRSASLYERVNKTDECIAYDCRVIYMISGDVTVSCRGEKPGHLTPGNLLYIPAGTPYKLKGQYLSAVVVTFDFTSDTPAPEDRIPPSAVADFKPELCHNFGISAPFDKVIKIDDMTSEGDELVRMSKIFTSAEGNYRAQISAMFKLLLLKIAETSDEHSLPSRMVEALDSYIMENCSDEISNTEIGAIFGYHPFYVSTVLKEAKGQTLRQYIISFRLKAAKRMLELSAKSINEIAEQTGFTDASYFTKTFRGAFGMTPKEYRNRFKDEYI